MRSIFFLHIYLFVRALLCCFTIHQLSWNFTPCLVTPSIIADLSSIYALPLADLTIYRARCVAQSTLSFLKITVVLHTIAYFSIKSHHSRSFPVKPNVIRCSHSHQDLLALIPQVTTVKYVAALDTAVVSRSWHSYSITRRWALLHFFYGIKMEA